MPRAGEGEVSEEEVDVARRGGGDECGAGEEVGVVRRGGGECRAPGRWMSRAPGRRR